MAVLLVTYDLNKEAGSRRDYEGLLKYIKDHAWARLSESSYAIETNATPTTVFNKIRADYIDPNDYLFVITLTQPWEGFGPKAVIDWLRERLGY